ncbi:NlpC/P60 family protein [Streptomyces sp. SP17BM10]|uniref:C40 family peptidase n=1 Tax=Streptomyces sp. SP17BM10 TaxID=3002530 RepID=UPI002E774874|nr:NlpC/P60 family protein [Streptomyces sp. SP17BM10]MEE1786399.1 NlpC/P60 family protein [Streptomyces sp. SP17BM10]
MGKRRKPSPPSRARLAVLTTAVAGGAVFAAGSAHAEPTPTLASVKEQVDKLNEEAEQSVERYNGFQAKQQTLQADANRIQDKVARGQEAMNELRTRLGAVAGEQYRTNGIDPGVQLMLDSDPAAYLERAAAQNQVVEGQTALLKQARDEQRRLDQDRAEAAATLAQLDSVGAALGEEKKQVQSRLAQAQALLNKLSAADRARINAQESAEKAKAAAQQAAAADRASRSADRPAADGPAAPTSGRAADIVKFAYAQLGKPYGWSRTGPDSFDCSGLTGAAYRAAGVKISRISQDQWNDGPRIARGDLQPGDLVFFYDDIHHVGIYIGDGKMIHAPRTGKNIEVLPIAAMPYMGAVRPA